jgi:hypothetical protein
MFVCVLLKARGEVIGDGVRIHSLALPGLVSSVDVRFSAPGEVGTIATLFFHRQSNHLDSAGDIKRQIDIPEI